MRCIVIDAFGKNCLYKLPSILGQKYEWLTPHQRETLEKRFQADPYVERGEKPQLAMSLNISEAKISVWFVRRRNKEREKGLLGKYKYLQ